MTPKEKAQEILDKFDLETGLMSCEIRQCALILVDALLNEVDWYALPGMQMDYWGEVKRQIELL